MQYILTVENYRWILKENLVDFNIVIIVTNFLVKIEQVIFSLTLQSTKLFFNSSPQIRYSSRQQQADLLHRPIGEKHWDPSQ